MAQYTDYIPHNYDCKCRCPDCIEYELNLRASIKGETIRFEISSGPILTEEEKRKLRK
jgi:hypothetical protein